MGDWAARHAPYIVATVTAVVVLGAGGLLTEIGPWYDALRKPRWQPPDWLFAPAWTTIGILCVWSAGRLWSMESPRGLLLALWVLNCMLNIAWSLLFFRLRRPEWAFIEVVPLWLSILALIAAAAPSDPLAAWLLAPYLVWVSFAAVLNRTIVRLNPPIAPHGVPA